MIQWNRFRNNKKSISILICLVLLIGFWFSLPSVLFTKPYSAVLLDQKGRLLQARIAADGQWRFPHLDSVPEKFNKAIIAFEDKRFEYHPGVDPLSLTRAIISNISNKKVVSGGSTITMQVIRLSRNKPRTAWQKLIEIILALRLELTYSKKEILDLYADHAPFGGNVVGINAAAWRYFGRPASQLSWGESASLAVLPNNPAMVRPDRNRNILFEKRNRLLDIMCKKGIIDQQTADLAKLEPVPDKPLQLPELAPHLLSSIVDGKLKLPEVNGSLIYSTINGQLQQRVNQILYKYHEQYAANGVNNAAALILDVETGNVLAYAGNVYRPDKPEFDSYVDVIPAPRSPGSTLKPLLYASMLKDGLLLPHTLVADIPTQIAGYSPQNFDLGYDGAVPASKALARSLNVPAVRMLQQYRIERFYEVLKRAGITTLTQPSAHYGLSLILGGGENSVWELGGVYASLARILNHYSRNSGKYDKDDWFMPQVFNTQTTKQPKSITELSDDCLFNAGSIYHTFNAMNEVMRPGEEYLWTQFTSSQKIAWKTGTSFGFRDGWAIGVTSSNVIVVWIGNADGEGRPGLTGVNTAAPVMFELFKLLPSHHWFDIPYDDLHEAIVCSKSGYLATELCEQKDTLLVTQSGLHFPPCPYHQLVHLDRLGNYRVTSECESTTNMQHKSWFVLPPTMEWYYKNHDHTYRSLPPWRKDCMASSTQGNVMEMIYPKRSNTIYVPVELDGKSGKCVFEVAHRHVGTTIYWHLDGSYIGSSKEFHQMALSPSIGKHLLVLVDENGERLEQYFEILKH